MPLVDYRLRMLLAQSEAACQNGCLTRDMLSNTILEFMAYKEPVSSDIRNLLGLLTPGVTPQAELLSRLRQAQGLLNIVADYD